MYYKTIVEDRPDIGSVLGAPVRCPVTGQTLFPVVWVTPNGLTRYDLLNATQVARLGTATPAEWEEASRRGAAVAADEERKARAKADALRYGVPGAERRTDWRGGARLDTVHLVRVTHTQIVGAGGERWARRTGRAIRGSGAYGTLTPETMAAVEGRAAERQVADFVADGKRAP